MTFWGVKVKPGKPYTHIYDDSKGRLHVSMATLGSSSRANEKSTLQCNVGRRRPVFLCSLYPRHSESMQLNLEFEQQDRVVFSVIGPTSIHLSGYYLSTPSSANADSQTHWEAGLSNYVEDPCTVVDARILKKKKKRKDFEDKSVFNGHEFLVGNQSEDRKVKKRKKRKNQGYGIAEEKILADDQIKSKKKKRKKTVEDNGDDGEAGNIANGLVTEELEKGEKDGNIAGSGNKKSVDDKMEKIDCDMTLVENKIKISRKKRFVKNEAYERKNSNNTWKAPRSDISLIQEDHLCDPWRVLVICVLLNRTTGEQVKKVLSDFFKLCPDAKSCTQVSKEEILKIIRSLGLHKRVETIQRLSEEYLCKDWKYVTELHGIGKYGADAYAILINGMWDRVTPSDHKLNSYWKFLHRIKDQL